MKNHKFTLSPNQEINLANKGLIYQNGKKVFPKAKKSIFYNQKSLKENIFKSLSFAVSFIFCAVFTAAILTLIINFLNY